MTLFPQISGPYVTLATVAALALLERMVPGLPDPSPVVLMAVVYAAFAGGLGSGLFSAAIAVASFAGQRAEPGALFTLAPEAVPGFLVLALVTPLLVLMVARLKARAERVYDLQAEQQRLRELDRMKTQFLNNAAHELRTPLTPIVIQLRMLKKSELDGLNEKQVRALDMVDRNIGRLNALVQDLLEVAKLQAGKLTLQRRLVELDGLAAEAVESFREPGLQAGVRVELRAAGGLAVDADAKRLIQVLFNLVTNAMKFTPPGGRITVETARAGAMAEVRVHDTGSGLTREQLARLFQPFTQVHDPDTAPTGQGTGLGLYICRGIVEQHGGTIRAESAGPGRGATFAFALPLAATVEIAGVAAGPAVRPAATAAQGAGANR